MNSSKIRAAGILLILAALWYLPWTLINLNWHVPWLSIPFAIASLIAGIVSVVAVITHWQYSVPEERPIAAGQEPDVAIIISTYGEHPTMVYETAKSVMEQDYPEQKIRLLISDDAHRAAILAIADQLKHEYPRARIGYHRPPRRGDSQRRGEAKAGNLNSAFRVIKMYAPRTMFIETRDADDRVGDPSFLRQAIGQLVDDDKVAFVQTAKDAQVSPGDPFGNQTILFYQKAMLAKNADNAVFPQGSGIVWRRQALDEIGGFPTWNLMESLQSGAETLRRGWRGVYLPIVGAVDHVVPEDVPSAVRRRGSRALDAVRLTLWGDKRGLNWRQWLHFVGLGLFYVLSLAALVFAITPVLALIFDVYPLDTSHTAYALHFWPYVIAASLWLVILADGLSLAALWRTCQTWLGMVPVYARATLIALGYGLDRKPAYRTTRKEPVYDFYWREMWPQLLLFLTLIVASLYHVAARSPLRAMDVGNLFWAGFLILGLSRSVRNTWHGIPLRHAFARTAKPEQVTHRIDLEKAFVEAVKVNQVKQIIELDQVVAKAIKSRQTKITNGQPQSPQAIITDFD